MFTNVTFGRVKRPCEDCLNGECTMNCSGAELADTEPDFGSVFVTRTGADVTIRVRSPHSLAESKVTMPFKAWKKLALPRDTT